MNRITELRTGRNKNMAQTAKELDLPYTTYVSYEKGDREPNSEALIKLANYFSVSVDYLLGRDEPIDVFSPADPRRDHLLELYHQLNDLGKDKLISNGEDLAALPKYTAEPEQKKPKLA